MTGKKKTIIVMVIVLPLIYVTYWGFKHIPSQDELCKQGIEMYRSFHAKGVVKKKFVNAKDHNHKTIIINEEYNQERIFILNADTGGMYNFIEVGDSITKNRGELFVSISRNKMDTLIDFKFRCGL